MIIEILILAAVIVTVLIQEQRLKALTDFISELDEKLIKGTAELRDKIEKNTIHIIEVTGETEKINKWKDLFHNSVYSALNHFEEELHEVLDDRAR